MHSSWAGYNHAVASDPYGTEAVLRVADQFDGMTRSQLAWGVEQESGWDPAKVNPWTHAGGLIQWMPKLHPYAANAPNMTREEQAPLVARFFAPFRGHFTGRNSDVYLAIAYGEALLKDWPDERVVSQAGEEHDVWRQNPPWRSPGNGPVTVGSIRAYGGEPFFPGGPSETPVSLPPRQIATAGASGAGGALAVILAALGALAFAWRARHG